MGLLIPAHKAGAPTLAASRGRYLHRSLIPSSLCKSQNSPAPPLAALAGFWSGWVHWVAQGDKHKGLGNGKHISEEERKITGQRQFQLAH